MFDVLIIGGGASGMSCALVLGSAKKQAFATDKQIGIITHQKTSHLQNALFNFRSSHFNNRESLFPDGVDFNQTQEHTLTELLYISFMEPSAERLSFEWNMTLEEIEVLTNGIQTHVYEEFPFLGDLFYRDDIKDLGPFEGLEVSTSVREESEREVNYLND